MSAYTFKAAFRSLLATTFYFQILQSGWGEGVNMKKWKNEIKGERSGNAVSNTWSSNRTMATSITKKPHPQMHSFHSFNRNISLFGVHGRPMTLKLTRMPHCLPTSQHQITIKFSHFLQKSLNAIAINLIKVINSIIVISITSYSFNLNELIVC